MKKQNTTTKATTSKAPRENPVPKSEKANKLTLTALGRFAQDYADPEKELAVITDEKLRAYGVVESKAGLLSSARGIYLAANFMASCRESAGWKKAAKTANNQAKKEKASKTKEANKKKADAAEEQRVELEAAKAELKELKARTVNVQAVLALVMASHATPEEKKEIVTLLSGKTPKQAERAAHVAASKAVPKAEEAKAEQPAA